MVAILVLLVVMVVLMHKTMAAKVTVTLIAVRVGDGNDTRALEVHNAVANRWEEVCSTGWNQTFALLTCRQLGYR